MAKALQSPCGRELLPNPLNALKLRRRPSGALEGTHDGWALLGVVNAGTGIVMRPCPVVIPVSWLIELEGPVAYLRRLAAHRRRVREGQRRAQAERALVPSVKEDAGLTRQQSKAEHAARRHRTYVGPTEVVVPGRAGIPHLLFQDVRTVRCRRCDAWLLGSAMTHVRDAVFGPGHASRRRSVLQRVLPSEVAVTLSPGESYCPACVPGGER